MGSIDVRHLSTTALVMISLLAGAAAAQTPGDWRGRLSGPRLSLSAPRVSLLAGPHLTAPVGDFYRSYSSATGFGLGLRVGVDDNLALRLSARRSNLAEKEVIFVPGPDDTQEFLPYVRTEADIWRFSGTVEFSAKLNSQPISRPALLYLYLGAGLLYNDLTLSYHQYRSELDLTLNSGAGILFMVTSQLGMEIGGAFDIVYVGNSPDNAMVGSPPQDEYAGLFDISASMVFALSRN